MRSIKIGNRMIGPDHEPLVIMDIGINHEGSIEKAKQMVLDAYKCGAEIVKFQGHIIEDEMVPEAKKVIPANTDKSIWDVMDRCALTDDEVIKLKEYVEELGMIYLCTPFSRAAADRLEKMGVVAYKIGSGECNNYPLIKHIASFRKPVILSTGMNDILSIREAVKILEDADVPHVIFQCTSIYPTPYEHVNLGALAELKKEFPNAVIGLSDHSLGNYTCFAAVALGASVLEKHFTSDKSWSGPDISISIDPTELRELITGVKAIHRALGGSKKILKEEQPTIDFAYACVVSIRDIERGEKLTKENTWVKRPGTGEILAKDYEKILGRKAKRDIKSGKLVRRDQID